MYVIEHETPASYALAARDFLMKREDLCGLPLGILLALEKDPSLYNTRSLYTVHEGPPASLSFPGEAVIGAAHWTRPHPLCLSPMPEEAIAALAEHISTVLRASGEPLTGLAGEPALVSAFERLWARNPEAPPLRPSRSMEQGLYRLDAVTFPAPTVGTMRLARESDRALLEEWEFAFCVDCEIEVTESAAQTAVARALASKTRYVLEVERDLAAMAGVTGHTPNGARIANVYTPPRLRGRGHASELVASLSAKLLDSGLRFLTLYTDLANPTSNSIYQKIGYARIGASRFVRFQDL